MSTRKIIDPKQNGEKVWLKSHAQATYMSDGSTVEDAINNIEVPSLDDYASKEWVNNRNYATEDDLNNIDYSSINNVPVSEDETGELNVIDGSGNIGMKVASEAVYAKDFIAGEHKLSEKQDIITDIEDIRRGASKGDNSGVFVKFNELFAEGTLTTNESDIFNVVKTAMESNTPLLLCDNNYSVIQVSHYPLKVGNTIIASGTLSQNVYNFTFASGSNQVTVTKLSVATLSDNLVSVQGLKSPQGKSYALPDADAADWADACLLSTEDGILRFLEYPDNHVGYLEGFFDEPAGNVWALPNSDLSVELGLENTLASRGDAPSYYTLNNSASPSTLELMGYSAPTRQEPGNIIAVRFSEQFQQQQEHEFVIDGNAWMLPEDAAVQANGGETMLFVFSNDYIVPVGAYESFYAKKAEVLQTSRTINGVYFNGSSSITNYTTCSTAADTAAKTASLPGLTLTTGARVSINFTNGNTAASMTLNVSSTGAKTVNYRGGSITPYLSSGTYDFIYTGSAWELLSTKGIHKFTMNSASYTGVVYPDSFIRFYYSTGVTTLNVSSTTMSSAFAEYSFEFNSGSTPTVFTYPSAWKWANGTAPTINANKTYHVSVINNCAVIAEF